MGKTPLDDAVLPPILRGYGSWHRLHDPSRRWSVPFSRILGRCYESAALKAWFSPSALPTSFSAIKLHHNASSSSSASHPISRDLKAVLESRAFSRSRHPRIAGSDKSWFWADSRVEQLDLLELKNFPVGPLINGRPGRDPQALRRAVKLRTRGAGHKPKHVSTAGKVGAASWRGRPSGIGDLLAASVVGEVVPEESEAEDEDDLDVDDVGAERPPATRLARMVVEVPSIDLKDITVVSDGSSEVESEVE